MLLQFSGQSACQMGKCFHCSAPLADDAAFCSSCGRPASSASQLPTIDSDERQTPLKRTPTTPRRSGSSRSSGSDHGGFVPGAILANRFRIVSLLGRGGMGEVYRADDLELGQAVALKFLPTGALGDEATLERFRGEVRNARQIAHPNVCRVYDIGEHDGRTFLSMEYVDGEDLASLLRRIGRLPAAKADEVAQQVCAGLAAAHSRQILHRDLKPSNVLIDGRGFAHLTDFGLAIHASEDAGEAVGTPAYMAPEQFRSEPATQRTDVYALGLVLFELYTGKRPFDAANFTEYKQRHLRDAPRPPSETVPDLEPGVERAILKCLEKEPTKRLPSALAVAAALPGGNTLAAVIAAGETPSPEMVAASGEEGALSMRSALLLSAAFVLCVAAIVFLSAYSSAINLFPPGKSPDSLVDRAKELSSSLGGVPSPADYAWWFGASYEAERLLVSIPAPKRYREIANVYPTLARFGYRQSPRLLQSPAYRVVARLEPAPFYSGEVSLTLDLQGRLLYFARIPPQKTESTSIEDNPDWHPFFQAAEISPQHVTAIPALWTPDVPADRAFAWKGEINGYAFEIHAASHEGQPVFFHVANADETPTRVVQAWSPGGYRFAVLLFGVIGISVLLFSLYFGYRNLRSGRGDRRGTIRMASAVYVIDFLFFALTAHHLPDIGYEWNWLQRTIGLSATVPLMMAVYYLALEPFIRRTWPEVLVSWTRLMAGRLKDPLVGRDIFLGVFFGALHALLWQLFLAAPYRFPIRGETPSFSPLSLASMPAFLGEALHTYSDGLINSMGALSAMFLLGRITKSKWIVSACICLLWAVLNIPGYNLALEAPVALLSGVIVAYVIARFGLLAVTFLFFANIALLTVPFSLDFNRWYAARGILVLFIVAGLAFYGIRAALGSRSILPTDA